MHVRSNLRENSVQVIRLHTYAEEATLLLEEYYQALGVVQRDTPEAIRSIIEDPGSGMWLAWLDGKAVGCVVLRKLASVPLAGECKRLYLRPNARGQGLADKLLDAMERFAIGNGLLWIYLDSYDDLRAALTLYRRRGYVACENFNDNPQATIFLRKYIGPEA